MSRSYARMCKSELRYNTPLTQEWITTVTAAAHKPDTETAFLQLSEVAGEPEGTSIPACGAIAGARRKVVLSRATMMVFCTITPVQLLPW